MKPTTAATLLLIATFLGGLMSGVLLERLAFGSVPDAHAATRTTADRGPSPRDGSTLALQLDLSPEQRVEIDRILAEQQRQIRAILSETRPQTRAVLRETRAQIEEILTPEQQARWKDMYRESRQDTTRADQGSR